MEKKKEWRLIDSGPCGAFYNMALDEAIAASVKKNDSPPTLRLYSWDKPSVSLGCFQKASDINIKYCKAQNIPIVRRLTGGRAILHDDELTYSFSVRTDKGIFSKGLLDSYKKISKAFALAFNKTGIYVDLKNQREKGRILVKSPLCFQSSSYGEILIDNRKVIGSAQKRWSNGLLQQGCIPYSLSNNKMPKVFGSKRVHSLRDQMIGIREVLSELNEDKFKKIIQTAFEESFGVSFVLSHPSEEELLLARKLEDQKYTRNHWNLRQ